MSRSQRAGRVARTLFVFALAGLIGPVGFAGCSDDESTPPDEEPTGSIHLQVVHEVNGDSLEINALKYRNAAGDTFSVQLLEYYISDIQVLGDVVVNFPGVFYVNPADSTTLEIPLDGIPEGHYHAIAFTFGLDEARNHSGALPSTVENRAMEWPETWGGGYHYMKIEGRYVEDGQERGYATHSGRYADDTRPAEHHFFPVACTMHKSVLAGQTAEVELAMEILEWYETPHTIPLAEHGTGIMDNYEAQVRLEENGVEGFLFEARPAGGQEH